MPVARKWRQFDKKILRHKDMPHCTMILVNRRSSFQRTVQASSNAKRGARSDRLPPSP